MIDSRKNPLASRPEILAGLLLAALALPLPADNAAEVAARTQADIGRGSTPAWWSPTLPENIRAEVGAKGERLAADLQLGDDAKTQKAAELIAAHFGKVWAWHQQADEKLNAAWSAWDDARDTANGKQKDELKALTIMTERIDPIYAEFVPQIQGFLSALRKEIGEEKTNELLDRITRRPGAKRTHDAYCAMIPEMTADEKAILWKRLAQARELSLAAGTDNQIVKIFKAYKVRNEFSIDYFGYGYQKRYQAWAAAGAKPKE